MPTSAFPAQPTGGSSGTTSGRRRAHSFHVELTHPIIEVANHIISPLTASLTIFGVHKMWQIPAARAWASAARVLVHSGNASYLFRRPGPGALAGLGAAAALLAYGKWGPRGANSSGVSGTAGGSRPAPTGTGIPAARAAASAAGLSPMPMSALEGKEAAVLAHGGSADGVDQAAVDALVDMTELARLYSPEDAPLVAAHLSHFPTVVAVERNMRWLHDTYGLSWWATIVGCTLALRTALAPLNISLLRNSLRMKVIMPQVEALMAVLKQGPGAGVGAVPRGVGPAGPGPAQVQAAKDLLNLFARSGCHPFRHSIAFPILLPSTILSIFGAIHNLSVSAPGMDSQGALWFPDLLAPDVTHLLPIASALTWLMNVESGAGIHYHATPRVRSAVRVMALMCWPLASTLPNGVLVFWVTSNLFALARAAATRPDAVRRLLRLPLRSEIAALTHLPKPMP